MPRRRHRRIAVPLIALVLAGGAAAAWLWPSAEAGLRFQVPANCTLGTDCTVQNYVDHDPGPQAADFTCGRLTYDGHKGTDLRLPDLAALNRDVAVLAAAAGTVLRVRDSMPDVSIRAADTVSVEGMEAGNSVIIDHGDGWETQYAHLRRGSVAVAPGERVEAGQRIGAIGLSGQTEFPHLHFEVRRNGQTVDPYTGPLDSPGCGQTGAPMWTATAAEALAYRPTGLLAAGLAGVVPTADGIRAGAYVDARPDAGSEVLVFWVAVYGIQPGDSESFAILAPDGSVLVESANALPDAKAQRLSWAGRRQPDGGWPSGTYRSTYRLMRAGETVLEVAREAVIR